MTDRKTRVWLLTNLPKPYQMELFGALARSPDIDLSVRFMRHDGGTTTDDLDRSDFDARVVAGLAPRFVRDELRLHPRTVYEAAFADADCFVLSGIYTSITFLMCAIVLTLRGRPWCLWLERPSPTSQGAPWSSAMLKSWPARVLRRLLLCFLFRAADRVICMGSAAVSEYEALGVAPAKLMSLPYCCDIRRYDTVDENIVEHIQDTYGLRDKLVFLYSGQLVPRKGVETALQAFQQLTERTERDVALLLLGDGPERKYLESLVAPAHQSRIHFAGNRTQAELPAFFRAADVFVFPSRHDGWGVVVNEACAARLPVIATYQTGAAHDLVVEGESGFLLERDDVDGFRRAMKFFIDAPDQIDKFGRRSRELVERFSAENGARLFRDHIGAAIESKKRKLPVAKPASA